MAYLVTTMSGLEGYAQRWLSEKFCVQSYLPMVRITASRDGVNTSRVEPLFSGYLFLLNITTQWREVLETRGVLSFINSAGYPEYVEDSDLQLIRDQEDEDGFVVIRPREENYEGTFQRDQRLLVVRGAFAGKVVIHSGLTIGTREFAFFEMLGAKTQRFEFDHSFLIPAPEVAEVPKVAEKQKRRRRKLRPRKSEPVLISEAA